MLITSREPHRGHSRPGAAPAMNSPILPRSPTGRLVRYWQPAGLSAMARRGLFIPPDGLVGRQLACGKRLPNVSRAHPAFLAPVRVPIGAVGAARASALAAAHVLEAIGNRPLVSPGLRAVEVGAVPR